MLAQTQRFNINFMKISLSYELFSFPLFSKDKETQMDVFTKYKELAARYRVISLLHYLPTNHSINRMQFTGTHSVPHPQHGENLPLISKEE
jgi:hypothetical protein